MLQPLNTMNIGKNDLDEEIVWFECPDMLLGGIIIEKSFSDGQWHIKVKFGEDTYGEASDESFQAACYKVIGFRHFPEIFNKTSQENIEQNQSND